MGSYFQDEDYLNSGPLNTNPSSGREEDLNPGLQNYKSSPLITKPHVQIYDWV